ncbi:MAG: ATP-binding protein [Synergistaceae bacterium]|nr:ATP-binding protein [Synergistaceae bacterium]
MMIEMNIQNVRIYSINIQNFKNVVSGSLNFYSSKEHSKACVLGLYGQNGSGKTALIDTLELLQYLLCGRPVHNKFADYINIDAEYASLCFEFGVGELVASYSFDIASVPDDNDQNTEYSSDTRKKVRVYNEIFKCSMPEGRQKRTGTLISTKSRNVSSPKTKLALLTGKSDDDIDLVVAKKIAELSSRSFIFSKELLEAIRIQAKNCPSYELDFFSSILESLIYFGNRCLLVINTANSGLISLNTQTFVFKKDNAKGTIILPLNTPATIPLSQKILVQKLIQSMNIVLKQIIPGLTVNIKDLGTQVADNGDTEIRIQLMTRGDKIPLNNESEGIKKIISVLQLLIVVYNQPSITVAIDELDSGIFEYLLGEILRIISEKGKGQLIFTSHNLRPLETIDKKFIAFTTTNPQHRYVRMKNVKSNNNLRDFYYHDIMLGGQKELLYEPTHNAEIAFAFREAGLYDDT